MIGYFSLVLVMIVFFSADFQHGDYLYNTRILTRRVIEFKRKKKCDMVSEHLMIRFLVHAQP
jgi:hypothetical protein